MPKFFSWIVNRLRSKRFAIGSNRVFHQFAFYFGHYSNWKHSPRPLIFIMYSGQNHTHAIAVQYMNRSDKEWFARVLYLLKNGGQIMDGVTMYRFLKLRRPNIVKDCYRVYFTSLFNGKLVGAGLTDRFKEVYEGLHKDPWLMKLNESLKPSGIPGQSNVRIAYSSSELRERVIQSQNSIPIQQRSIRKAPWSGNRAPWAK